MIYTAAHGVGNGLMAKIEQWFFVVPATMAIVAITALIATLPQDSTSKSNNRSSNAQGQTLGADSTATNGTAFVTSGNTPANAASQDKTTTSPNDSASQPTSSSSTSTQGGSTSSSNSQSGSSSPSPSSTSGSGGSGDSTTHSDTSGSGSQDNGGLTVPLLVCVGDKSGSLPLLGSTTVCVN